MSLYLGDAAGDADGAPITKGTPIKKMNSDPGDAFADGTIGVVRGSIGRDGMFMYCVEWEPMPDVPIWISMKRIETLGKE